MSEIDGNKLDVRKFLRTSYKLDEMRLEVKDFCLHIDTVAMCYKYNDNLDFARRLTDIRLFVEITYNDTIDLIDYVFENREKNMMSVRIYLGI